MGGITDRCSSRRKELIDGCDVNAHHTISASTGANPRGDSLMEYMVS
jgi:hypothetical protein